MLVDVGAAAIALYVVLGLRGQELLNAKHSWIKLDLNEFVVPASDSKSGKSRTIPLNARAPHHRDAVARL